MSTNIPGTISNHSKMFLFRKLSLKLLPYSYSPLNISRTKGRLLPKLLGVGSSNFLESEMRSIVSPERWPHVEIFPGLVTATLQSWLILAIFNVN